ncbi:MAG: hypothetical protein HQ523_09545 [Lentisphaerae bacterium]|nr:hypothetical protein [Lentisphaerota bacterium]
MKRPSTHALCMALLPLLALAAYLNTFTAPFVFDDMTALVQNPNLGSVWPIGFSPRWLVDLSFDLNYLLHGRHVAGYHLVNLLIHVGAGLLLYGIVRRTLLKPHLRDSFGAAATPLAFVVTALWVVHPLQTESVTYMCQRYESLMGLCFLATLYAFIRATDADAPARRRRWANAALVVCALGMGTKEVMVAAPLVVWLYDALFVGRSWTAPWRERWRLHLGLFLTLGILVMFELLMMGRTLDADQSLTGGLSPWLYLATQTEVILHYIRLSFLPYGLCLDYAWPPATGWGAVLWPALLVSAIGVATLWALWRRHPLGFAGASFFIILAPTSSVLPVPDIAFEHRMYLPLACLLAAVIPAVYALLSRHLRGTHLLIGATVVVLALTGLTLARNHDYRSELALWRSVVDRRPGNLRAGNDLAIALAEAGQRTQAARQFEAVLAAIPPAERSRLARGDVAPGGFSSLSLRFHYFRAHANYGRLLANSPATRPAAIEHYVLALRAAPHQPEVEAYLREALRADGIQESSLERAMLQRILDRTDAL